MNEAIKAMLKSYGPIKNEKDKNNALKEIVQSVTLSGLQRGGFFQQACFCGETALRILYGLDRFSEDLDFCLIEKKSDFKLQPFFKCIKDELERYGFYSSIQEKKTGSDVVIESAFVKQETVAGLLVIEQQPKHVHKNQLIKVKLEVDKMNPEGFTISKKLVKLPVPYMITTLSEDSLFAGKLHALLARAYSNRVKGRDFYDFLFYMARGTQVNFPYLESKLRDSGHYSETKPLDRDKLVDRLTAKFMDVDFDQAKQDVLPFIRVEKEADINEWSKDLFISMANEL